MKIDEATVLHVAGLARLRLTNEEVRQYAEDLHDILSAFSILDSVDTTGVAPSFRPIEERNVLRADEPGACLTQAEALRYTKDAHNGFFIGPRTIQ